MAVGAVALTSGSDSTDSASAPATYTTAAVSPTAGRILVLVVGYSASPGLGTDIVSVTDSGLGVTWVIPGITASVGGNRRVALAYARVPTGVGASKTISFTVGTATAVVTGGLWSVFELTGAEASARLFVQNNTTSGTSTSGSVTLGTATAANAGDRCIAAWVKNNTNGTNPRGPSGGHDGVGAADWTEIHDVTSTTPSVSLETQIRTDAFEATASASWTGSVAYEGFVVEVRAAPAAQVLVDAS